MLSHVNRFNVPRGSDKQVSVVDECFILDVFVCAPCGDDMDDDLRSVSETQPSLSECIAP